MAPDGEGEPKVRPENARGEVLEKINTRITAAKRHSSACDGTIVKIAALA